MTIDPSLPLHQSGNGKNSFHKNGHSLAGLEKARETVRLFRKPCRENFLISAHRGLRWAGVAENSLTSLRRAAEEGLRCVEIDIKLTSDDVIVCLHDDALGRATNIGEHLGRHDIYSPYTGRGYHPLVDELPWNGCLKDLRLKDEYGAITEEHIMTFEGMIECISNEDLGLVVFMDIKDKRAMGPISTILAQFPEAAEWCVCKPDTAFYPFPSNLEAEDWFSFSPVPLMFVPVLEPGSCKTHNVLQSAKEWASRPYVISLEIGLRGQGGRLQSVLDWATSPEGPGIGLGFFAALGDIQDLDASRILYEHDIRELQAWTSSTDKFCFNEWARPSTYHEILVPGCSADQRDYRGDIELYRSLGFTWMIADKAPEAAVYFDRQCLISE